LRATALSEEEVPVAGKKKKLKNMCPAIIIVQ
jgi:hypothetical protein